jgi:hypothetical protein
MQRFDATAAESRLADNSTSVAAAKLGSNMASAIATTFPDAEASASTEHEPVLQALLPNKQLLVDAATATATLTVSSPEPLQSV